MQQQESFLDIINKYLASDDILLPVFDESALRIQQEIGKQDPDLQLIEKLIGNDSSLTGQVLKIANSAFYKGLTKVSTIRNAIIRLGVEEISNIVMLTTQRKNYYSKDPFCRDILEKLWHHSTGCAIGSQWLSKQCHFDDTSNEAFTAGLLHDIGKLFLLKVVEDLNLAKNVAIKPSHALMREVMDNLHTEHGNSLLMNWNLPKIYCEVARDHHTEGFDSNNILLAIVRLANKACNKLSIGINEDPSIILAATPEASLLGLSEITLAQLEIVLEDTLALAA
jgi:HD-like signal output (HDOD) protein